MNKTFEKQPTYSIKSGLIHGCTSILSMLPRWLIRKTESKTTYHKLDFIDLNRIKEKDILFRQYTLLSEELYKITQNRESFNNFSMTLNGAIFGAVNYVKDLQIDNSNPKNLFIGGLWIFGFTLSLCWLNALSSIKKNIDIRNEMLIEIEKFLPAKIFTTALLISGRCQGKGSLSYTEKIIPLLFLIGYITTAIIFFLYPNIF